MKIALAQFAVERGDPATNLETIRCFVAQAKEAGACALFLPEMCTTGFDWQRNVELLDVASVHRDAVAGFAKESDIAICGSFLAKTESGRAANTFYFFERSGEIAAAYRKVHLFTLFNEDKHVEAGERIEVANTELGTVGCSICYDLRFPELFRACTLAGAALQVLPAAFPHPRLEHWQTLVRARAIENQCFFIATNQCGSEVPGSALEDIQYFGHSMVVDPWGEILLEAGEDEGIYYAQIDPAKVENVRNRLTALQDRRPELY
jgi:predicted amidohydrolase